MLLWLLLFVFLGSSACVYCCCSFFFFSSFGSTKHWRLLLTMMQCRVKAKGVRIVYFYFTWMRSHLLSENHIESHSTNVIAVNCYVPLAIWDNILNVNVLFIYLIDFDSSIKWDNLLLRQWMSEISNEEEVGEWAERYRIIIRKGTAYIHLTSNLNLILRQHLCILDWPWIQPNLRWGRSVTIGSFR